jgi:hypothetical protein
MPSARGSRLRVGQTKYTRERTVIKTINIAIMLIVIIAGDAHCEEFPASKYFPKIKGYNYLYYEKSNNSTITIMKLSFEKEGNIAKDYLSGRDNINQIFNRKYIEVKEMSYLIFETVQFADINNGEFGKAIKKYGEKNIICRPNIDNCASYIIDGKLYYEGVRIGSRRVILASIDNNISEFAHGYGGPNFGSFWAICDKGEIVDGVGKDINGITYNGCQEVTRNGGVDSNGSTTCNGIGLVNSYYNHEYISRSINLLRLDP